MNRLQSVFDITVKMKNILDENISSNDREARIEQLNNLLLQREPLLEQLTPPFSEEEDQLGKKLVRLNQEVQYLMDQLFSTLKIEMKQMNRQKKSNKNYTNPYHNVQVMDGMYLDKKK
ncbi:flagellar protein FliT [Oceanobacillus sp. Castelsardo]|uniref:flagellar protein FliT n=1 Tax=Oceanobacillus sp. Castelsardo TaxID=1851204 RepID=UPI000837E971|nr:flagellar protein FliT [Oceanobacillus sp. Castelsardo]